jgi:MOSC domain-containing protein YiiM
VKVVVIHIAPAGGCRLLDDGIGAGAAAALRRRAGSVCRVLSSGTIRVGDTVEVLLKRAADGTNG